MASEPVESTDSLSGTDSFSSADSLSGTDSFSAGELDALIFMTSDPLIEPFKVSFDEQCAAFWTSAVIKSTLIEDKKHWEVMDPRLKHTVSTLLHYLLYADFYAGSVAGMTAQDFSCGNMIIKGCFEIHAAMENVHADTYQSFLTPLFGSDQEKWRQTSRTLMKSPASLSLLEWGRDYARSSKNNPLKFFLGMICYEGLMFNPFFAIPYALKKCGLLPAFCMGNELIARDENKHMYNYVLIMRYFTDPAGPRGLARLDEKYVKSVIANAVTQSCGLLYEALPADLPEFYLVRDQLVDYTKLTANGILRLLGYSDLYSIKYPDGLPFMIAKDLPQFTSFHSSRPSEYALAKDDGRSLSDFMCDDPDE